MTTRLVFIDRRRGQDRRFDLDPCKNLPMDLYHRMRRKNLDRRSNDRTLSDDYYAFLCAMAPTSSSGDEPKCH
jgi:hypothetical protein